MMKQEKHIADQSVAGKTCAICQTVIISGDEIVSCAYCGQPFHVECWEENGGCAVYGCQGAPETQKSEAAAPAFVSTNAWGETKQCPACQKEIKSHALKCRHCGASFGTRDVIGEEEYNNREYEGKEYATARNQVIVLLLVSATGLLSPITLILSAILLFRKKLGPLNYRRLPAALKLMVQITFWLNIVLILALILICMFDQ